MKLWVFFSVLFWASLASSQASYHEFNSKDFLLLNDIGFGQQVAVFDYVQSLDNQPCLVIDSAEFLAGAQAILEKMCAALSVEFDAAMLAWPTEPRDSDGVWGKYWSDAVNRATGFAPYQPRNHQPGNHQSGELSLNQQATK